MKIDSCPVSYAQERMWRLDDFLQDHFSTAALNVPCVLPMKGKLDIDALSKSLKDLVNKHASLRTIFFEHNNLLYQKLLDKVDFEISIYDLSDFEKQKDKADNIIRQETEYEFSLSNEILFRTSLIILDQQNFIIIFLFHHLISDEWSLRVFFKELEKTYEKHLIKEDVSYPIDTSYLEFSERQRRWLEEGKFKNQYKYWSEKLRDLPHEIHFPIDKPIPKEISTSGYFIYELDESLCQQIKDFSRAQNTTIFMIFLAAYKIAIQKYSQCRDIFVATPIGNRHYKNVQNTIGCFVNAVLLRTTVDENKTYKQLIDSIRETALEAYDHQDIPFNLLMDALDASEGFQKYIPQFVFELKKLNHYKLELPEIVVNEKNKDNLNHQSYITLEIEYTQDLFEEATISKFMNNLITIVESMIQNPEALIRKELFNKLEINKKSTDCENTILYSKESPENVEDKKTSNDLEAIMKLNKCLKLSVKDSG